MSKYGPVVLSVLFSAALQASPIEIIGVTPVKISTTSTLSRSVSIPKTIVLQKLKLSASAKIALKGRINELQVYGDQDSLYRVASAPLKINLGMANTPVLDQGSHGSCVTFAFTAAIDAALAKGDYASQLCSLELGNYLVNAGMISDSGWDGTWGDAVFSQLKKYGIVSKSYQTKYGCPTGVKAYPIYSDANITRVMSIAQYMAASIPTKISGTVLASIDSTFSPNYNPTATLNLVKAHLRAGHRVVIGFLLDDTQGDAGAVGSKAQQFDTWVMNATILKKAKAGTVESGHEIVVYGYDDTAVVRGSDGKISKGVLILRNSWSVYAGDAGNYYMSYDYFKYLADEAMAISK